MALSQSTQFGLATALFGVLSFVFAVVAELRKPPYGTPTKRPVSRKILFGHTPLYVFFHVVIGVTVAGTGMTVWPMAVEAMHHVRNVHRDLGYACPTTKTGVLGGAVFLNLDAILFWIVCLMLVGNVKKDYFNDNSGDGDGGIDATGLKEK